MYGADVRLEDRLAPDEPPYRSRGEGQIGRLLDRYGIPFIYEQPTVVYADGWRRVWHPDFTLPQYANLIVEYAGMPDVPDYMAGIRRKRRVYTENRMPFLFLYTTDLQGATWPKRVMRRIATAGPRYRAPRRYIPRPRLGYR